MIGFAVFFGRISPANDLQASETETQLSMNAATEAIVEEDDGTPSSDLPDNSDEIRIKKEGYYLFRTGFAIYSIPDDKPSEYYFHNFPYLCEPPVGVFVHDQKKQNGTNWFKISVIHGSSKLKQGWLSSSSLKGKAYIQSTKSEIELAIARSNTARKRINQPGSIENELISSSRQANSTQSTDAMSTDPIGGFMGPISVGNFTTANELRYNSRYSSNSTSQNRSSYRSSANSSYQLNKGGSIHVNGYYRSDGTYVRPHTRSNPDTSSSSSYFSGGSGGSVQVRGYYRSNGTYVRSHTRSRPR